MKDHTFPYSDTNHRYHSFDYYLKHTFGGKCLKIPLDGGFSCPNLDGSVSVGGCAYCNLASHFPDRAKQRHGTLTTASVPPISEQFAAQKARLGGKWNTGRYLAYFQDFTNTHATAEYLERLWSEALAQEGVVGIHIATRADAVDEEVEQLLRVFAEKTELTVELGLQTVHDSTARHINRGHSYDDFQRCFRRLQGLNLCVHLINGLPGESREMMVQTARTVGLLRPHSVKIHLLHVLKGSAFADSYLRGELPVMSQKDYIETVCDQLEVLPPETVIARLTGDALKEDLLAPFWSRNKLSVLNGIDRELKERNTVQGVFFQSGSFS